MLQVAYIRENRERVLNGLAVRNFPNAENSIQEILSVDEVRKATQTELDAVLAESNKISKEIGNLFKSGEQQKANILKEKTGQLKELSKDLNEKLNTTQAQLKELLYQIPNIPHKTVPSGSLKKTMKKFSVKETFLN